MMDAIFFCKEFGKPFLKGESSIGPFSYGYRINKKELLLFLRVFKNKCQGLSQVEKNS